MASQRRAAPRWTSTRGAKRAVSDFGMVDVAEQGDMRRDSGKGQRMATDEEEAALAILALSRQPLAPSPGPAKNSKRKANKIETCETLDSEPPAAEENERMDSSTLSARDTFLQQASRGHVRAMEDTPRRQVFTEGSTRKDSVSNANGAVPDDQSSAHRHMGLEDEEAGVRGRGGGRQCERRPYHCTKCGAQKKGHVCNVKAKDFEALPIPREEIAARLAARIKDKSAPSSPQLEPQTQHHFPSPQQQQQPQKQQQQYSQQQQQQQLPDAQDPKGGTDFAAVQNARDDMALHLAERSKKRGQCVDHTSKVDMGAAKKARDDMAALLAERVKEMGHSDDLTAKLALISASLGMHIACHDDTSTIQYKGQHHHDELSAGIAARCVSQGLDSSIKNKEDRSQHDAVAAGSFHENGDSSHSTSTNKIVQTYPQRQEAHEQSLPMKQISHTPAGSEHLPQRQQGMQTVGDSAVMERQYPTLQQMLQMQQLFMQELIVMQRQQRNMQEQQDSHHQNVQQHLELHKVHPHQHPQHDQQRQHQPAKQHDQQQQQQQQQQHAHQHHAQHDSSPKYQSSTQDHSSVTDSSIPVPVHVPRRSNDENGGLVNLRIVEPVTITSTAPTHVTVPFLSPTREEYSDSIAEAARQGDTTAQHHGTAFPLEVMKTGVHQAWNSSCSGVGAGGEFLSELDLSLGRFRPLPGEKLSSSVLKAAKANSVQEHMSCLSIGKGAMLSSPVLDAGEARTVQKQKSALSVGASLLVPRLSNSEGTASKDPKEILTVNGGIRVAADQEVLAQKMAQGEIIPEVGGDVLPHKKRGCVAADKDKRAQKIPQDEGDVSEAKSDILLVKKKRNFAACKQTTTHKRAQSQGSKAPIHMPQGDGMQKGAAPFFVLSGRLRDSGARADVGVGRTIVQRLMEDGAGVGVQRAVGGCTGKLMRSEDVVSEEYGAEAVSAVAVSGVNACQLLSESSGLFLETKKIDSRRIVAKGSSGLYLGGAVPSVVISSGGISNVSSGLRLGKAVSTSSCEEGGRVVLSVIRKRAAAWRELQTKDLSAASPSLCEEEGRIALAVIRKREPAWEGVQAADLPDGLRGTEGGESWGNAQTEDHPAQRNLKSEGSDREGKMDSLRCAGGKRCNSCDLDTANAPQADRERTDAVLEGQEHECQGSTKFCEGGDEVSGEQHRSQRISDAQESVGDRAVRVPAVDIFDGNTILQSPASEGGVEAQARDDCGGDTRIQSHANEGDAKEQTSSSVVCARSSLGSCSGQRSRGSSSEGLGSEEGKSGVCVSSTPSLCVDFVRGGGHVVLS